MCLPPSPVGRRLVQVLQLLVLDWELVAGIFVAGCCLAGCGSWSKIWQWGGSHDRNLGSKGSFSGSDAGVLNNKDQSIVSQDGTRE